MQEHKDTGDIKQTLIDLADKHFPKDECKERGAAMVLAAEALMAIERLIAEARTDELEQVICHKHGFGKDSCPQIKERLAELNQTKGQRNG